jgi:glycosyltransferase involved in cell wall biosynthesis
MDLSLVIPVYNEVESLPELTAKIKDVVNREKISYEICFIDDGSTDGSLPVLRDLCAENEQIKVLSFRRNCGKSAALSEGFKLAQGEIVITMDADLQDDPEEIPGLIAKIREGYDLISGWKKKRFDPLGKTIPSKLFNKTTSLLTGIKIHDFNCGLKAYRHEVIKEIPVYGELHRYLPVLAHWQGYNVGEIVVQHHARKFGVTKFGWERFFSGFFDLLTVLFITRYRQKPMHLFGFMGLISFMLGSAISLYLTFIWMQGKGIGNRPLLFLGVLLIIVGVQLFSIGLIGEMITNSRDEQQRYSIKEAINTTIPENG